LLLLDIKELLKYIHINKLFNGRNMNTNIRLILKAKEILRNTAPLPFDCGTLCENLCCKGSEDVGMLLFPDEEHLYINSGNFEIIDGKIIVCKGHCDRDERPLSCMLYPLFPVISEESGKTRIRLIPDIRGSIICPLTAEENLVTRDFERAVRRAVRCLIVSPEHRRFIDNISEELSEIYTLRNLLIK